MQLKIKYILLFVFFVFVTKNNFAQQGVDSVQQLGNINIVEEAVKKTTGPTVFRPSAIQKQAALQNDISDLLQTSSPVQINSYGLGNISTISVRGGNDDHTNVYWNGLKLNALTHGGTDLSLIPIESGRDIQINTNTSSIGGDININSKPDWNNLFSLHIRSDIGSFNSFRNNLGFKAGNKKVQFQSDLFYLHAKNNFTYIDKYKFDEPVDTADHNSIISGGTVNTLFLQLKNQNFITIGSWFQQKNKDVPSIMGSNEESNKFQNDRSVRHFINWDKNGDKISYHLSAAHSYDELYYTDKKLPSDTFLLINSSYKSHRISQSFNIEKPFKHNMTLTTGYHYNLYLANVKEYVKSVTDHVGDVYARVKVLAGNVKSNFQVTQPFSSFKYIRPQFYIDAGYSLTNNRYSILFSYSDKYRFPDLNDRYWNPGGNPKLKPETGWSVNLGNTFSLFPEKISKHQLTAQVNIYYSKIKNNIVWTPVSNIVWSPKNLKSTRLYGIESQVTYSYYSAHGLYVSVSSIYNFNRSQILQDENNTDLKGNLLRYKPQHVFKSNVYLEDRFFGIGLNYRYVSGRFTDEENFKYFALKPYHLLDMFVTFKGDIKEHQLQFIFRINNITNTSYESIRSYAQPMRYYTISFIYSFSKRQNSSS